MNEFIILLRPSPYMLSNSLLVAYSSSYPVDPVNPVKKVSFSSFRVFVIRFCFYSMRFALCAMRSLVRSSIFFVSAVLAGPTIQIASAHQATSSFRDVMSIWKASPIEPRTSVTLFTNNIHMSGTHGSWLLLFSWKPLSVKRFRRIPTWGKDSSDSSNNQPEAGKPTVGLELNCSEVPSYKG